MVINVYPWLKQKLAAGLESSTGRRSSLWRSSSSSSSYSCSGLWPDEPNHEPEVQERLTLSLTCNALLALIVIYRRLDDRCLNASVSQPCYQACVEHVWINSGLTVILKIGDLIFSPCSFLVPSSASSRPYKTIHVLG